MTEYFEVHARDGAARVGELRLRDPVTTPALADDATHLACERSRMGLRYAGADFETQVYVEDGFWQTTIPYWVDLLGVASDVAPPAATRRALLGGSLVGRCRVVGHLTCEKWMEAKRGVRGGTGCGRCGRGRGGTARTGTREPAGGRVTSAAGADVPAAISAVGAGSTGG